MKNCRLYRSAETYHVIIIQKSEEITQNEMTNCAVYAGEVVISGLSGRFPESDNIAEFREHLINGDDMTTEDDRRWQPGEPI